jgi:hypothetical protein
MKNASLDSSGPWWKYGHVWLVVSGPAIVVVAGFITLYLAITRPDPLIDKTLESDSASRAPALQGRNHAQTGVKPGSYQAVKP